MRDFREHFKSVPCNGVFLVVYFKTMCNKTNIRFSFCDIRIITVSVSVINLGLRLGWKHLPRPWLFRISQLFISNRLSNKEAWNNYFIKVRFFINRTQENLPLTCATNLQIDNYILRSVVAVDHCSWLNLRELWNFNILQNYENKPQGLYFWKARFEGLIFGGAYLHSRGDERGFLLQSYLDKVKSDPGFFNERWKRTKIKVIKRLEKMLLKGDDGDLEILWETKWLFSHRWLHVPRKETHFKIQTESLFAEWKSNQPHL